MILGDAPLGSTIVIARLDMLDETLQRMCDQDGMFRADVVGRHYMYLKGVQDKHVVLGFSHVEAWVWSGNIHHIENLRSTGEHIDLDSIRAKYRCGWWVDRNTKCQIAKYVNDKPIIDPHLVCGHCSVSAPHTKPNVDSNQFICESCTVLLELR